MIVLNDHYDERATTTTTVSLYLFQKVPGFLREVRRKAEFAFEDLVDGLLSVFASERRL